MKASTTTILATLTALASAQYSGNIVSENRGDCPIPNSEGDQLKYSYDPSEGNLCLDLNQHEIYAESYHAVLYGHAELPDAEEPTKFGGCADSKCTQCDLVDVNVRSDRPGSIESECTVFENKPYLFIGVPEGNSKDL
ncbi:hypothetical protein ASPSYDRAFT_34135 [Aspergillus sydowii CBS 593.65]|jgi:hypothetical protein|uniref:Cyanovirin-N domain-containing protein n=1 Tax=Aspergillus sydowii CBS 593.65 TaxID=1036612 RepID=A0A1L9T9M0_9EURO|nr:uncharacterized protein ASPSYDRAFT_34135 [Aspergillus sydowii CBS 593.65]OJJ56140.1 hypothetical protein ASPSYDRAFT_34135 [Aspergillus sydowii CBS 593.65]